MGSPSLEEILGQVITQAQQAAARGSEPVELPEDQQVEAERTAHDDRIRIHMVNGRVQSCDIQPLAMRLSNVELGEQITEAINTMVAAYQKKVVAAVADQRTDFDGLSKNLM